MTLTLNILHPHRCSALCFYRCMLHTANIDTVVKHFVGLTLRCDRVSVCHANVHRINEFVPWPYYATMSLLSKDDWLRVHATSQTQNCPLSAFLSGTDSMTEEWDPLAVLVTNDTRAADESSGGLVSAEALRSTYCRRLSMMEELGL